MTREGTRLAAVIAAAALAAALLAACGSSDSSTSTSTSSTAESTSQSTAETGEKSEPKGGGGKSSKKGGSGSEASDKGGGGHKNVATPLKVTGGGSGPFRTKGGDNSIQNYGEEGDESELQEAAEAVHGFYVARAEGRWADACSHLSKSLLENLEQLAEKSTGLDNHSCAPFLEAFTSRLAASEWREITTVDARSVRHDGEQAFLIYYGSGETPYAMPLKLEDGEWKVTALSSVPLR